MRRSSMSRRKMRLRKAENSRIMKNEEMGGKRELEEEEERRR